MSHADGIELKPPAMPHQNAENVDSALACIREMLKWAERDADHWFEASNNAGTHKCRTCRRVGLREVSEMYYHVAQAKVGVLKVVLTELEDYCIANY